MTKNKKPLLVGNWKMNPVSLTEAKKRFAGIRKAAHKYRSIDVVLCPPYPFISTLVSAAGSRKPHIAIGSQDVSLYEEGQSKTGEVGAAMVQSTGARYVIVGHSERRALGETGQTIALKVQQVLKAKMNVIICVGEKERDADGGYLEIIKAQLKDALAHVTRPDFHQVIVAYEPVWAIGRKDNTAISSYDLHQMVVYIKKFFKESWGETIASIVPILYGGSVTPDNAEDIIVNGEVDGLLIGRASFEAASFSDIFDAISTSKKNQTKKELKKTLTKAKNSKKTASRKR